MVAAEDDGQGTGGEDFADAVLDVGVAFFGVGMHDVGIADVDDAAIGEIGCVVFMVVGAGMAEGEEGGGFADGAGAETGAGAPLRAAVERGAEDGDIGVYLRPV